MRLCLALPLISSFAISFTAPAQQPTQPHFVESHLPILFEPAPESAEDRTSMVGHANGLTLRFTPSALRLGFGRDQGSPLDVSFDGATRTFPIGDRLQTSQTNYLLGNNPASWRTHVPNYARVLYPGLYPGIDAVFYGNGERLEHDFVVAPGADPRQIRMRLSSKARTSLSKKGVLSIALPGGTLHMQKPAVYQQQAGLKQPREGSFQLFPDGTIGFTVGAYDHTRPLVIDPVLSYATYLSPLSPQAIAVATDASSNTYVTGVTSLGYPVTPGALQACADCTSYVGYTFVSKLSADGTTLLYSTVLGGNGGSQPTAIAVDASGNALVSGTTEATDFPVKSGQPTLQSINPTNGYLISLSPDGSSLNFGTLLGVGPSATNAAATYTAALALDAAGNAYVTGTTSHGYITTPGALNNGNVASAYSGYGGDQVFLSKFTPIGSLLYSAVLGEADPQMAVPVPSEQVPLRWTRQEMRMSLDRQGRCGPSPTMPT